MAAALILVISVVALMQFAISQWRLIWLTTANQPLSETLQATTGIDSSAIQPADFNTLLDFCDELSPQIRKATPWLREVRWYYGLMTKVQQAFGSVLPALGNWAVGEMKTCARFAAVVLDQNLSLELDRRAAARPI
jgi:hypothetical protein